MNLPKVTVGVILFKETKYLKWSLHSLLDQDYADIQYIIRDHSPNGEVHAFLKEFYPDFFEKAQITIEDNATMHSGGHNAMIRQMTGEVYFCVSNDMLYPKNFVSSIVKSMQKEGVHVATCELMQWNFEKALEGDLEGSKTDNIDSFGIGITKGHKFFDRGQGLKESIFENDSKVLGPSGAVAIFDKVALEAIAYRNKKGEMEYFDETLYYKNDCDLAYRLSWAGFKCAIVPVKVYHDRQLGEKGRGALGKFMEHHQKVEWAKESSLLGHLVVLKKNFDPHYSFSIKLRTALSGITRYFYTLFFAPKMLNIYVRVKLLSGEIEDRKKQLNKIVTVEEMEKLMV